MNYLMSSNNLNELRESDSEEEEISVNLATEEEENEISNDFIRRVSNIDDVNFASEDRQVVEKSKKAVLTFVENFVHEKKKEGLTTEQILSSLGDAFATDGKLSRQAVIKFVKERKAALEEIEHVKSLEKMEREQDKAEQDLLDSVKERADSQLLDDDYEINGARRQVDTNDYDADEFMKLKYTSVCFSPNEFKEKGYNLRCVEESGRKPRLMVVITMKDEGPEALRDTLRAIGDSIHGLQEAPQRFNGFGTQVWKDILVCIVVDGRLKLNDITATWLEEFGLLKEGFMKYKVDVANPSGDVEVRRTSVHMFERSVILDKEMKTPRWKTTGAGLSKLVPLPPIQTVLAIKEVPSGELDSHWWFYDAFCDVAQPDYTFTLQVGAAPSKKAFTQFLTTLAANRNVGAVSGNLNVRNAYRNPFNFIKLAQQFEFKAANLLENAYQAAFGYVTDLPPQFSGYRYEALKDGPLDEYFRPLEDDLEDLSPFAGNMFHAQNRVLATEILVKKQKHYKMTHVWGASATVEVPSTLSEFIVQRKRTVNSSLFTYFHILKNSYRLYTQSSHDSLRRIIMIPYYVFQIALLILSWLKLSLFVLPAYYTLIDLLPNGNVPNVLIGFGSQEQQDGIIATICVCYGIAIITQVIVGMGNKVKHVMPVYSLLVLFYFAISSMTIGLMTLVYLNDTVSLIAFAGGIGVLLLFPIFQFQLHHALLTFIPYLCILPINVNILTIYSISNLHDVNFGTDSYNEIEVKNEKKRMKHLRGKLGKRYEKSKSHTVQFLAKEKEQAAKQNRKVKREAQFTNFRSVTLLAFMFSQVIVIGLVPYFLTADEFYKGFAFLFAGIMAFKGVFAMYFFVMTFIKTCMFYLYNKYGWRTLLFCYGEEMSLRRELERKDREVKEGEMFGEIDRVYEDQKSKLLFVRETNDNGSNVVRESEVYDRSFLKSTI